MMNNIDNEYPFDAAENYGGTSGTYENKYGDVDIWDLIEKFQFLISKMENEGFHYCFKHYSKFEEINDTNFHSLRENYLSAAAKLEDYIYSTYSEMLEDEIDYYHKNEEE